MPRIIGRIWRNHFFGRAASGRGRIMYAADLHCDTISALYYRRKRGGREALRSSHLNVSLDKMQQGGYVLQNFAIFTDIQKEENPYLAAKEQIALFQEEMRRNSDKIRQAKTAEEIRKNREEGLLSAILTLEEGEILEGSLEKLEEFYDEGVRMMTLTWNYENSLAKKSGLTEKGIAFLQRMEALGILPDVSHLPDGCFSDVCRFSRGPLVASHSNARALCGHRRNLTDAMIRNIAERGGVIGVNYYGLFLEEPGRSGKSVSRVERIAEHILHMMQVGGVACVGLGSDFDGFCGESELEDCAKLPLLEARLQKKGLREAEIEAVFSGNVLRLYQNVF